VNSWVRCAVLVRFEGPRVERATRTLNQHAGGVADCVSSTWNSRIWENLGIWESRQSLGKPGNLRIL